MANKNKKGLVEEQRHNPFSIISPQELDKLLNSESDRGIILIATAYLEELLGTVIAAACISTELADSLLRVRAPAGDFEARLLIAQAFGLVHADEIRCLRIFQKIRNKAAHFDRSGKGFDVLFDTAATADQVSELTQSLGYKLKDRQTENVKVAFLNATRHLAISLLVRHANVRQPLEPKSEREVVEDTIVTYQNTPYKLLIQEISDAAVAQPLKLVLIRSLRLVTDKILDTSLSQEKLIDSFRSQLKTLVADAELMSGKAQAAHE